MLPNHDKVRERVWRNKGAWKRLELFLGVYYGIFTHMQGREGVIMTTIGALILIIRSPKIVLVII